MKSFLVEYLVGAWLKTGRLVVFKFCLSGVLSVLIGCAPKQTVKRADSSDRSRAIKVEARGSGREWRFSYSGPDGILGTSDDPVSDSHLMLPAGADVAVQLRSNDYIYVFSCPQLNLKEIAVRDLEFSIDFRADQRGEYDLVMDPMCGFRLPPGKTMGIISVVSERDFRRWLEGARD